MRAVSSVIISFLLAPAVSAAILDIQPTQLPEEIKVLTAVSGITSDGSGFVFSGSAPGGGCVIAVTTRELVLTARRSFPSLSADACFVRAIDSLGNVLVYGTSRSSEFLFTSELVPGEVSNSFLM